MTEDDGEHVRLSTSRLAVGLTIGIATSFGVSYIANLHEHPWLAWAIAMWCGLLGAFFGISLVYAIEAVLNRDY